MSQLLQAAFVAASELPETEQDAIATLILEKISEHIAPSPVSQANLEFLEQHYIFRDRAEVVQFLEKYPLLLPIILEAPSKIRKYFPAEKLLLKVVHDPEIIDDVNLVLSIILTHHDPHEAMDREDQLRKDWLWKLPHGVKENFHSILEYSDEF